VANQTTSNTSNSIRTQYLADYVKGAMLKRNYDQFASPIGADMTNISKGNTVTVPFLSSLAPSSQTISETVDLTPVNFVDATVSVTKTSRGNAVVISEALMNNAYTDFNAKYYARVGENMMETVDLLAMSAAVNGGLTRNPAARASLDAGTTTHRITKAAYTNASVTLAAMKVPMYTSGGGSKWMSLLHPFAFADLLNDTPILAVGEYQDKGIVLNNELGELAGFKLIVTPWAKMLWAAGVVNTTSVATTLAAAANPLDLTVTVNSASNIAAGQRIMIGTVETGSTMYNTNESVIVKSISSTTVTIIGEGENGGLRFAHAANEAFKNADNVAPVIFGGPESLAKVYDTKVGEYGELVGPKKQGLADQFTTLAWKWYGNYAIIAENRILRSEFSLSMDA
jgi:N4-gp56 family major capsid protein